jgi:hypothetical protein
MSSAGKNGRDMDTRMLRTNAQRRNMIPGKRNRDIVGALWWQKAGTERKFGTTSVLMDRRQTMINIDCLGVNRSLM